MKYILAALLLANQTLSAALPAKFLNAVHQVETGGRVGNIVGDNGKALGPFQIHKVCWQDSGVSGNYSNCTNFDYSAKVMEGYLKRYCPKAVQNNDFQTMARVWNGGPSGAKKSATVSYWKKVQSKF